MANELLNLTNLSIAELIDIVNSMIYENNSEVINERGEYYKLCGHICLDYESEFVQKVKEEIDEWKNKDIEEIENKDYEENICYQDSYEFFEEQKNDGDKYEREYSDEYLKLVG